MKYVKAHKNLPIELLPFTIGLLKLSKKNLKYRIFYRGPRKTNGTVTLKKNAKAFSVYFY